MVLSFPMSVFGQEEAQPLFDLTGSLPAIEPAIQRPEVNVPAIDNEIMEVGAHIGVLSVEDFGSSLSYGLRLALHATESIFVDARVARASVTDEPFRRYNLTLFGSKSRVTLDSYAVAVGWNVLPGEVYLSDSLSLNSAAYLLFGAGNIRFAEDDYFAIMAGMGIRILPTDWLSVRLEAVGYEYESNIFGYEKFSHNFEASLSLNVFF